jgi:hypothetical protein
MAKRSKSPKQVLAGCPTSPEAPLTFTIQPSMAGDTSAPSPASTSTSSTGNPKTGVYLKLEGTMRERVAISILRDVGDTAIWCMREAHHDLAEGKGYHHWSDIESNMETLTAVNVLLAYFGAEELDLATHVTEIPT